MMSFTVAELDFGTLFCYFWEGFNEESCYAALELRPGVSIAFLTFDFPLWSPSQCSFFIFYPVLPITLQAVRNA